MAQDGVVTSIDGLPLREMQLASRHGKENEKEIAYSNTDAIRKTVHKDVVDYLKFKDNSRTVFAL